MNYCRDFCLRISETKKGFNFIVKSETIVKVGSEITKILLLSLQSAGITAMCHQTQLEGIFKRHPTPTVSPVCYPSYLDG